MKLRELKTLINAEPTENDELEVQAYIPPQFFSLWMGGTTVIFEHRGTMIRKGNVLMIEARPQPSTGW